MSTVKNLKTLKSKMADGRHFEKKEIEKSPYLSNGLIDCHEILYDDACSHS